MLARQGFQVMKVTKEPNLIYQSIATGESLGNDEYADPH